MSGMEEGCTGSQVPQQTVALEKKTVKVKKKKKKRRIGKKKRRRRRIWV
jgi:hypothetical protein